MLTPQSSLKTAIVCTVAALVGSNVAHADQCQAVTKKQAELAKTRISAVMNGYALFCAPCGDAKPRVTTAKTIEVKKSGKNYEVVVDGTTLDLAYVYTHDLADPKQAANLGQVVGCKVQGAPLTINMGTPRWEITVPKSTDPYVRIDGQTTDAAIDLTTLAGTWTVTTTTELSTCSNDVGGTKNTTTWTTTAANSQLKIKSSSGGGFTGQLDASSKSIVIWNDSNRAASMTQLMIQNSKTLTGRQIAAQPTSNKAEPACAVYRTVTATKAN